MKLSKKTIIQLAILAVVAMIPLALDNDYYLDMIINIFLWALLAGAWNLTAGYGGLLSLGHAAFLGIGAYTSTILFVKMGVSPWIGMLAGGLLATAVGVLLGYLTIRLKGPFFSLATMAFGEIMTIIAVNARGLTRGSEGISIPFKPSFANLVFQGKIEYFYIGLMLCLIPIFIAKYLEHSKIGYYLMAIREDEVAAKSLGVKSVRVKLIVTAVGTFLTAVGGTFYAQYIAFIDPYYIFSVGLSIQIALMAIIGGMGTPFGPVLGAILISVASSYLRSALGSAQAGVHMIVYGLLLVVIVILIPHGLISLTQRNGKSKRLIKEVARRIVKN
ncbi:MAG: branched-chain amino acid ABC transporter permease [Desulfitobacteriaceae bacterium]|nr:branched-chain amino acid ABC transporter permease [Desulfitobacteriaceae bacterium]MDI6914669.1 branched-chain amino acid ABC transporter permease [Desulfitobacteriaceae bacterium]